MLQGLTLPPLIRRLEVADDGSEEEREELKARLLPRRPRSPASTSSAARSGRATTRSSACAALYEYRRRRLKARAGKIEDDGFEDRSVAYQTAVREVLEAQRDEIVRLRNEGTISNELMHRLERELDLEDERLGV